MCNSCFTKKIVFSICFVILIINSNYAQKTRVGFNGGLTYSSFRGNPQIESFDSGFDFLAGISFEYQLKERLSLIANINYDRKSASQELYTEIIQNPDDPGFYGDIKIKFKNQFISLPILLRYKFGAENSFYVIGGPFMSYILKSELTNDYDTTSSDETNNYKKIDFGLVIGFGKIFKLKNSNEISVEIRENIGFANISAVQTIDNGSIKTCSLSLICNYSFDLK
jgi:hypothetical protein